MDRRRADGEDVGDNTDLAIEVDANGRADQAERPRKAQPDRLDVCRAASQRHERDFQAGPAVARVHDEPHAANVIADDPVGRAALNDPLGFDPMVTRPAIIKVS